MDGRKRRPGGGRYEQEIRKRHTRRHKTNKTHHGDQERTSRAVQAAPQGTSARGGGGAFRRRMRSGSPQPGIPLGNDRAPVSAHPPPEGGRYLPDPRGDLPPGEDGRGVRLGLFDRGLGALPPAPGRSLGREPLRHPRAAPPRGFGARPPGVGRSDPGAAVGLRCAGDPGGIRTGILRPLLALLPSGAVFLSALRRSHRRCDPGGCPARCLFYPAGENNVPQAENSSRGNTPRGGFS